MAMGATAHYDSRNIAFAPPSSRSGHVLKATVTKWSRLHRVRFAEAQGEGCSRLTAEMFGGRGVGRHVVDLRQFRGDVMKTGPPGLERLKSFSVTQAIAEDTPFA